MSDPKEPTLPPKKDSDSDEDAPFDPSQIPEGLDPMGMALGLADPNYDPDTNKKISLEGLDFTEPGLADVSKHTRLTLGHFLNKYVRAGRSGDGEGAGNNYYPANGSSISPDHKVGDAIPAPSTAESVNQFVDQTTMTQMESDGLGLPKMVSTPGTDIDPNDPDSVPEAGQTLGTFFTANQIKFVLDKTGGTEHKLGSQLFTDKHVLDTLSNTKTQLKAGNRWPPEHTNFTPDQPISTEVQEINGIVSEKPTADQAGVWNKDAKKVDMLQQQEKSDKAVENNVYKPADTIGKNFTSSPADKHIAPPVPASGEALQGVENNFYTSQGENIAGVASQYKGVDYKTVNQVHEDFNTSVNYQGRSVVASPGPLFNKTTIGPGGPADMLKNTLPTGSATPLPIPGAAVGDTYQTIYEQADPVVQATLSLLEDYNLYSPTKASPFFKGGSYNEESATQGLFTIQRELGRFVTPYKPSDAKIAPAHKGGPLTNVSSGQRVSVSDMAAMAMTLLVESVGDTTAAEKMFAGSDPQEGVGSTLFSMAEQMGMYGISLQRLNLNGIPGDGKRADLKKGAVGNKDFMMTHDLGDDLWKRDIFPNNDGVPHYISTPYNSMSHGQLNSFMEGFGDGLFTATGMLMIAIVACAALLLAAYVIEAISSAVLPGTTSSASPKVDPKHPDRYAFGRHAPRRTGAGWDLLLDFLLDDVLKVPRTDYPFGQALGGGMACMIGFPSSFMSMKEVEFGLMDATAIMNFAINLIMAPGYYATFIRQIVMSNHVFIREFANLGSTGFEGFFKAINKIVNSKIYQFLMISAAVGDANMKSYFGMPGVPRRRMLMTAKPYDATIPDPSVYAKKAAPAGKELTLTQEGVNRYRTIARLRGNVTRWGGGKAKNPLSLSSFLSSNVSDSRLKASLPLLRTAMATPKNVELIEKALDAEYVPFYFHDLRTSEIISMPAFITGLDETYTASYQNVSSYGRQSPVRLYQSTDRVINLTFKLVAFNESDFNAMWYTINKFVSMVYPQYSKGLTRTLKDKAGKKVEFTQPFSQVPAASPLIRIRLGDVLKSNYSATALERMFGYNPDDQRFKVEDKTDPMTAATDHLNKALAKKIKELLAIPKDGKDKQLAEIKANRLVYMVTEENAVALNWKQDKKFDTKGVFEKDKQSGDLVDGSKKKGIATPMPGTMVQYYGGDAGLTTKVPNVVGAPSKITTLNGKFRIHRAGKEKGKPVELELHGVDSKLFSDINMGTVTSEIESSSDYTAKKETGTVFKNSKDEFFKSANNAIKASFESSRGMGQAGVISSLGFNWSEPTWNVEPGSRAPKSAEIRMTFMPIFDLPVGLDSAGRLQAPSHPVGKFADVMGDPYSKDTLAFGERVLHVNPDYKKTLQTLNKATKRGGPNIKDDEE